MKTKEYVSDYNTIASKFIRDKHLSLEIQQNISFVENYVDKVEETFDETVEREIVYRELGVIVFSCIEALLKSVLFEINDCCARRECNKKSCKYRRYKTLDDINNAKVIPVLTFLINTRLFMLFPDEMDEMEKFSRMRNYVHISKKIGNKACEEKFNDKNVYKLLDYYYNLLDQLNVSDFYFNDDNICLKDIDSNGFKSTKKYRNVERKNYHLFRLSSLTRKLLWGDPIPTDEELELSRIGKSNDFDIDSAKKYIVRLCIPIVGGFKNNDEYLGAKTEIIGKLSKYLSEEFVKEIEKEI